MLPIAPRCYTVFVLHTLLWLLWKTVDVGGEAGGGGGGGTGLGGGGHGGHGGGGACPRACFCNTLSKIVYCSRRGLAFIPQGIPRDSLQINLNGNAFKTTTLQRSNFSRLLELEHLYLSDCGVEHLAVDTFAELVSLKWLDLSTNRIKSITDYTFRGLNLMHLFLNGNRKLKLGEGSFEGLVTNGLYLHDCSLARLQPDVLSPLNSTLRYLWLNGNELERVDKKFQPLFATLSHLRLGSNPLHCNCEVVWLKEFYDKNGDIFSEAELPSCLTPQRLKGKFFNELSLFDLRCQPPVFNNIDAIFDSRKGRLRCTATGDPAPTLYWIQPTGKTTRFSSPPSEDARKNIAQLNLTSHHPDHGDDLAGMYICVANNEAGNVTLTINVSWPHARPRPHAVTYHMVDASSPSVPPQGDAAHTPPPPGQGGPRRGPGHTPPPLIPASIANLPKSAEGVGGGGGGGGAATTPPQLRDQRRAGQPNGNNNGNNNNNNYTALNMFEIGLRRGERFFNLTELIGAIIGTHVCTLLLCLIFMPLYYKRKWRQTNARATIEHEKHPPSETVYLNGLNRHHPMDYMDIPTTSPHKR